MSAPQRLNVAPNPSNAVTPGGQEVPTGMISLFAGSTAPDDWLLCNGNAVSRIDYDDLFKVIGTSYGLGDGGFAYQTTNVNVPSPNTIQFLSSSTTTAAFDVPNTFTVIGGAANFNTYLFTVTLRTTNAVNATASVISTGAPVTFPTGAGSTPGVLNSNGGTTFNIPDTSGRTVRGVGTAGSTAVTLAQASGADATSVTLNAGNLPLHRHGISTPGGINIVSSGGTQVLGNTWNSTVQITNSNSTFLEDGTTLVSNTPFSVATTNQYLGLNYIIKT